MSSPRYAVSSSPVGQLVQGRLLKAAIMFVLAAALWVIWMGWIIHLWSILDAALYKPGN